MRDSAKNGWTGGQYSVLRALAGAALATRFAQQGASAEPLEAALHASGALWSLGFALGWRERACAFALAPTLIAAGFLGGERGPGQVHWLALAVLIHLAVPAAPFLSLDARDRVDPRGGWRMPQRVRMFAAAGLVGSLLTWWLSRSQPLIAPVWYALLAADPGWIAPRRAEAPERLYYDGSCGLCHRAVRFVLAEEPASSRLRFAPLHGEQFARDFGAAAATALPDSLVLFRDDGQALVRSRAALHLAERLGGLWRALALVARLVPTAVCDRAYDGIARVRKRLFRDPKAACPLLPPDLAARFDP